MTDLAHEAGTVETVDAATLYDLYRQRIRDYCIGQLRDRQEAEDAVQSTFLYALALLRRGEKPRRPLPWLYTIAHNVCRTRRRSLKRRSRLESPVDLETVQEIVGRNDPSTPELGELAAMLATLPPAQRTAFLLREWQGLSYAEIADRLGLTESAVEAVLFRARRNLARKLQPLRDNAAAALNGAFVLRALRRLAPFAGSAKSTATATALAGAAAAAVIVPMADSAAPPTNVRPVPASHVRLHSAPTHRAAPKPTHLRAATAHAVPRLPAATTPVRRPLAAATVASAVAPVESPPAAAPPQAPPAPEPPDATAPASAPPPTVADAVVGVERSADRAAQTVSDTVDATTAAATSSAESVVTEVDATVQAATSAVSSLLPPPKVPKP